MGAIKPGALATRGASLTVSHVLRSPLGGVTISGPSGENGLPYQIYQVLGSKSSLYSMRIRRLHP